MIKIILSNNMELEVMNDSTLFDLHVEPSQYEQSWSVLAPDNLKTVKIVDQNGDVMDTRENLVVDSEQSIREKGQVQCHFYLREKTREELLEEEVKYLRDMLSVHDEAIGELGAVVSNIAEGEETL